MAKRAGISRQGNKMMKTIFLFLGVNILFTAATAQHSRRAAQRPNIILILSDDMGFSDIGCYGGEIHTPNLNALAKDGLRYTQFYNTARCCPSRACLMTGLYPHQAGVGWMVGKKFNLPGYTDELNSHCVTIAEVLKHSGYATFMAGKWHLCHNIHAGGEEFDWPLQRGFEKFYGILTGAADYYDPASLCRGNTLITPFNDSVYQPGQYYFTNAITDNSIQFIRQRPEDKPFFLYVAYTAAHWPMQAPENEIEQYKGKYDNGWAPVRETRFRRMKEMGIIPENTRLSPPDAHPWSTEKNKKAMARRMETYAAMITIMDKGIGRMVKELKKEGIYNNTVIIFLQDNGACAEKMGSAGRVHPLAADTSALKPLGQNEIQYAIRPPITRDGKIVMTGRKVMAGPEDTYVAYLQPWANTSNTPLRRYKHYIHEGGISTPLIIHWPAGIKNKGVINTKAVCHEIDIMPTVLSLARAKYPAVYNGNKITPGQGFSLVPTFYNKPLKPRALYWEHEQNRAVRMGKWKLVNYADFNFKQKTYKRYPWELYNMENDRSETNDLAKKYPDRVMKMAAMWEKWAKEVHVFPAPWKEIK